MAFEKSSFLAIVLVFPSSVGDISFRFSLFGLILLTVIFPAFAALVTSSAASSASAWCRATVSAHFGSLDGCVGYGRASK